MGSPAFPDSVKLPTASGSQTQSPRRLPRLSRRTLTGIRPWPIICATVWTDRPRAVVRAVVSMDRQKSHCFGKLGPQWRYSIFHVPFFHAESLDCHTTSPARWCLTWSGVLGQQPQIRNHELTIPVASSWDSSGGADLRLRGFVKATVGASARIVPEVMPSPLRPTSEISGLSRRDTAVTVVRFLSSVLAVRWSALFKITAFARSSQFAMNSTPNCLSFRFSG